MWSICKKWSSPILLALLASLPASAATILDATNPDNLTVNVSGRETNRLAVEGRRIATVVPAQPGLIAAKKDEAQGVLYFRFEGDAPTGSALTLFVSDDQNATYKLTVAVKPIPAQDIVLRPAVARAAAVSVAGPDGRASSYTRRVKNLVLIMAEDNAQGAPVDRVEVNREIPLWQEARLVFLTKYIDGDLIGERYALTNVSPRDMLLVEQELYRRGVRGVSIKNHTLMPRDTTDIYVVRERKDDE